MEWSAQQDAALKAVAAWLEDPQGQQIYRLFGFAGTGKTTLATHLAQDVGDVVYGAFTGKAALVMRRKGCSDASTIHSMIYEVVVLPQGGVEFQLDKTKDIASSDLVIIDECSMVGSELAADLLSFKRPVLVLGDPAQLPPVRDTGFFTEAKPDFMLTEIHRQALENPIIRLSKDVREGRPLAKGDYGEVRVVGRGDYDKSDVLAADQVLVGRNKTRETFNRRIRGLLGFGEDIMPKKGERLICLKNDRFKGLFNGGMWTVERFHRPKGNNPNIKLMVVSEDYPDSAAKMVEVHPAFFEGQENELDWEIRRESDEFTYGHAITVHKSQGSQWDNVFLFDESRVFREHAKRWLYTGITRAAEKLTVAV